jgi:hypothetical protein
VNAGVFRSWCRFPAIAAIAVFCGLSGGRVEAQCPPAPANINVGVQSNCSIIHLVWEGDPQAVNYSVYWAEHDSANWTFISSTANEFLQFAATLLPDNSSVDIRVDAHGPEPCVPQSSVPYAFLTPAQAETPTGVSAVVQPNGRIRVYWTPEPSPYTTIVSIYRDSQNTPFASGIDYLAGVYEFDDTCGPHHYWVQTFSKSGCASVKVQTNQIVYGEPQPPVLISPVNGNIQPAPNITFSWQAACASSYTIDIAINTSFDPIFHSVSGLTSPTYTWTAAAPHTTYYWRVTSCNEGGCNPVTSPTRSVITTDPLPVLTSPMGGQDWAPGSIQTVTWNDPGPVKIELLADVTGTGPNGRRIGPSVVLEESASGGSASVTLPSDISTRRGRIMISRTIGSTTYYSASTSSIFITNPPPANTWTYSNVSPANYGHDQSDMIYDGAGGVHGVYIDYPSGPDVRLVSRDDSTVPWTAPVSVSAPGTWGSWPAAVLGADGRLHVAYYHWNIGLAKLYYNVRSAAGVWGSQVVVANIGVIQGDCSIVLDRQGVPMIAYNTGNAASQKLAVVKQQGNGTWALFGSVITSLSFPHHMTLRADPDADNFYLATLDLNGTRLSVFNWTGSAWSQIPSGFELPGPYTDVSLALGPTQNPLIAYTVPGTATGGQKLVYQSSTGLSFSPPIVIDDSPGTISSVDLEFGASLPRIGYVGNGVVKNAIATSPVAWTRGVVDATGNMDSQVSLVVNPVNDEQWFIYRDLTTVSMRAATPVAAISGVGDPSGDAATRVLRIGNAYPNPARTMVSVMLEVPAAMDGLDLEMTVFDVHGRLVRTVKDEAASPGATRLDWDLRIAGGGLAPNGVYFMKIRVGDGVESRRILLMK